VGTGVGKAVGTGVGIGVGVGVGEGPGLLDPEPKHEYEAKFALIAFRDVGENWVAKGAT